MNPGVLSAIVLAAAGLVTSVVTARNNRAAQANTTALESRKVDLDYFKEYRESMDQRLGAMSERVKELETAVVAERKAREKAEERAEQAEQRAERAEAKVRALVRRVEQLEQVLRDHHMTIPPPTPDPQVFQD